MNETPDERLNQLANAITRVGGISDDEAQTIASSPFLHARVRARIEAERKKRAGQGSAWLATLLVASRAIAILLVVTIAAAFAFWLSRANAQVRVPTANAGADNLDRVVAGGTCALSTTDECAISNEEVLATLFADEGGKTQR